MESYEVFDSDSDDDVSQSMDYTFSQHNNNNGSVFSEQTVLSTKEIYSLMQDEIKKVQDVVVELSGSKTRSLLNEFKWDSAKLLESILEGGKQINNLMNNVWEYAACDVRKSQECLICLSDISPENIKRIECNHRFCVDCLSGYLSITVKDCGLITNAIKCPGFKCKFELEDDFVLKLMEEEQLRAKYLQIIANSFVQNNRAMKWCPNANCHRAIQLESFDNSVFRESVRCDCGIYFCFKCHELSHDPIDCLVLIAWAKVKAEDFEAQNWILHNTKACPKCHVKIQKNGGCMHITCKCKHEFCWVCMGLWGSSHHCEPNDVVQPSAKSLHNIRRFSTYNAKHETMKQAYNLDVAQYKHKLDQGIIEMELESQWIKIDFISQAVEVLLQCRRTLMHSYIFSFFMTTIDNQMEIFEQNLRYLEDSSESLSAILEHEVTPRNVQSMKESVINRSMLCKSHLQNMIGHINEGYDKNWWRKFPIPPEELLANVNEDVIHGLLY